MRRAFRPILVFFMLLGGLTGYFRQRLVATP